MSDKLPLVFFKTIFDLLPEPILIIDKTNFKVKLCNIETQSLLEKSNEYLIDKELNQIFPNNEVLISNLIEMIKKSENFCALHAKKSATIKSFLSQKGTTK